MAAAIREPVILQRTLTVYGDVNRITRPLGIEDRSTIAVFLVEKGGAVHWHGTGRFDDDLAAELDTALRSSRRRSAHRNPDRRGCRSARSPVGGERLHIRAVASTSVLVSRTLSAICSADSPAQVATVFGVPSGSDSVAVTSSWPNGSGCPGHE